MSVNIPLKKKHRERPQPKSVKNMKGGNGKHARGEKVSWKAGTGSGKK